MIYSKIICSFFCAMVEIYTQSKILEKKYNFLNIKFNILLIILSLYHYFSYELTNNFIRTIILVWLLIGISKIIYKENIAKCLFSSFISWLMLLISEIVYMIFATSIFQINLQQIQTQPIVHFSTNFLICFINFLLLCIKPLVNFFKKMCKKFQHINSLYLLTIIFFISIAFSVSLYLTYINTKVINAFILNLIILLIYTIILIVLFSEKEKNYEMNKNIINISENLTEYENMLDYQRVANHENKNQLLVIKGMIKKNENNIIEYIDSIIKEKREENEDYYNKTKNIPSGGLQGLIYYKTLLIKEKKITLNLNIDKKIKKINLEAYGTEFNKNLCKSVGVLLDNAIQAVENLKEKNIDIIMINNNNFEIMISNNFEGEIDLENVDNSGYTTKGKGHGYGLTLLKQIIKNNQLLENKKFINGNNFTQKIIVKIKNK